MKRIIGHIALLLLLCLLPSGCTPAGDEVTDEPVWLNMNTEYKDTIALPDGKGERVKVILLLGQSNATGCGISSYLERNLGAEEYARYEGGFPSVLINYCLDDHNTSSEGEFVRVDMTCGATDGFFGPEVGIAEVLSQAYEGETVMMAPAAGFYTTPGAGINQVRIAYVLKKKDLERALFVLRKALEAYPGRVED